MELNEINNIWKKGSESLKNNKPLTMETMETFITKRSKAANLKIKFDIYFSLLLYSVAFSLGIYNTIKYIHSPNLVWILPILTVAIVILAFQSLKLIPGLKKIKIHQSSLKESIEETIHYFKKRYALWQLLFPIGAIILTFNINIIVDYDPAGYKIYHPYVFIMVTAAMYLFIYGIYRFTRKVYLDDLENCLKNLDSIEYTAIVKNLRRSKIFTIAFMIGLFLLFLGGLIMFLRT